MKVRARSAHVLYAAVGLCAAWLAVFAEDPARLDFDPMRPATKAAPVVVQPRLDPRVPEKEPEPSSPPPDALANLAPAEMASRADVLDGGFGLAFGVAGSGPGLRGGGGLGGDANAVVADRGLADRPARVLVRPAMEYPAAAKRRGVAGLVVIKIRVGLTGQAEDARIAESEPKGFFDEAVLGSVRAWKFEPAVSGGRAVSSWVTQRIRFEVE